MHGALSLATSSAFQGIKTRVIFVEDASMHSPDLILFLPVKLNSVFMISSMRLPRQQTELYAYLPSFQVRGYPNRAQKMVFLASTTKSSAA
jgi:hypothetical protein